MEKKLNPKAARPAGPEAGHPLGFAPRHVPARNRPLAPSRWHIPREDQLRARGERGEEGGEELAVSSYQLRWRGGYSGEKFIFATPVVSTYSPVSMTFLFLHNY